MRSHPITHILSLMHILGLNCLRLNIELINNPSISCNREYGLYLYNCYKQTVACRKYAFVCQHIHMRGLREGVGVMGLGTP